MHSDMNVPSSLLCLETVPTEEGLEKVGGIRVSVMHFSTNDLSSGEISGHTDAGDDPPETWVGVPRMEAKSKSFWELLSVVLYCNIFHNSKLAKILSPLRGSLLWNSASVREHNIRPSMFQKLRRAAHALELLVVLLSIVLKL